MRRLAQRRLAALAVVLAGATIALGHGLRGLNADAVIPLLVSLQRWTPFFWQQNRLGMLLPALALPVRSPFANLILQTALSAGCAVAAFFLLARLCGRGAWVLRGALSAALFLALVPEHFRLELFGLHQPYAVSLALGVGGVLIQSGRSRRRQLFAFALYLLALWVNVGLAPALLPLLAARGILGRRVRWRAFFNRAAVLVAALAVNVGVAALSRYQVAYRGFAPVRQWPKGFAELSRVSWTDLLSNGLGWALVALGVVAVASRRRIPRPMRVTALSALFSFMVFAALFWTWAQGYAARYAITSVVLLEVAVVSAAFPRLRVAWRRPAEVAAVAVLLAACVTQYGAPSLSTVRRDLDATLGAHTPQILAAGCTHLVGDYWKVWPAVAHGLLVRHERSDPTPLWGVSLRSEPTRQKWSAVPVPERIWCSFEGDGEVEAMRVRNGIGTLTERTRVGEVRVLTESPGSR